MTANRSKLSLAELVLLLTLISTLIGISISILELPPVWRILAVSGILWIICLYLRFRPRKSPFPEPVRRGAFIGLISLPAIVLGIFASPFILPNATASILINNVQDNDNALLIEAPYKVLVKGIASVKDGSYLYLVVYDGHFEFVQPDVVYLEKDGFEGNCYLGTPDAGTNKTYTIFAVITDKKYQANDHLDRSTVKTISNTIDLYRTR